MPVRYLHSLRFLVHRKRDTLIMRNGGPGAAMCHSTWKPLKYASARSAWGENYVLFIMLHLKRLKLVVCSQKICCTSTPNFLPFLPYRNIVISISVLSILLLCLSPDLHGSCLPFSCKFTSSEITEVNKVSKIFPLSHGEFIC